MIKKIFEKWFCKHKWKVHYTMEIYNSGGSPIPSKVRQTIICENCGKIKQINL